jgi:hypothetical protein
MIMSLSICGIGAQTSLFGTAWRFAATYTAPLPIGMFQILFDEKGCFSGSLAPATGAGLNATAEPPDAALSVILSAGLDTVPVSLSMLRNGVAAFDDSRNNNPIEIKAIMINVMRK